MTRDECIEAMARARHSEACDGGYAQVGYMNATAAYDAMADHIRAREEASASRISELEAENAKLREALNSIHSWLCCYSISTDSEMCESIPDMEEVARAALGDSEGQS